MCPVYCGMLKVHTHCHVHRRKVVIKIVKRAVETRPREERRERRGNERARQNWKKNGEMKEEARVSCVEMTRLQLGLQGIPREEEGDKDQRGMK